MLFQLRSYRRRRRRIAGTAERKTFAELQGMPPDQRAAALSGADAAGWIEAAALFGLVEAQVLLGQMQLNGTGGVACDPKLAFGWFSSAAAASYPPGLNMAGRCHELGRGTQPDPARAAALYRQAAEAGLDWAQFNLANLLLRGAGVPRDWEQALCWYRAAASQDHAKSMNMLGRFFENGWGSVPSNLAVAMRWYRRAAERGDFRGQFNLGSLLAQHGRKQEALRWLSRSVSHGSADFLNAAGTALSDSGDPDYQSLGMAALRRAQDATVPSPRAVLALEQNAPICAALGLERCPRYSGC